ncbi:MAG: hypothetical protein GXX91_01215 [Verrucomicrobiaceae bacterium]|nr:hypothetical protein [Verrucomicrobiaceae bacterium]
MATGFQSITLTVLLFALAALPLAAEPDAPARRIGVIFEGGFEKAEVTTPIRGARHTQLVACYEWDFGVRSFTQEIWESRALDWDTLLPAARAVADRIVERVEPELVRDARGVILYAILADEDPFLSSVLLSPKLLESFRDTLGDRIHVVLVDRHRLYLFPATGGHLADYGPALVEEFRRARMPVSLEVFLLDEQGYEVIGELERSASGGTVAPPLPITPPDLP